MNHKDNRFSSDFIAAMNQALDHIETLRSKQLGKPAALITTTSNPKIFSNGLVLEEAFAKRKPYFVQFHALLDRILCFPMPTVAAINGHAFAGGCMFALAHDYRVMRKDVGFMCLNEVDMPSPLTVGMNAIIQLKAKSPLVFRNLILQGHRFTATECLAHELIDAIVETGQDQLLEAAIVIAKQFSVKVSHKKFGGSIYQLLKKEMYKDVSQKLKDSDLGYVNDYISVITGQKAKL